MKSLTLSVPSQGGCQTRGLCFVKQGPHQIPDVALQLLNREERAIAHTVGSRSREASGQPQGDNYARDRMPKLYRLLASALQQLEQRVVVGAKLLQRMTTQAGDYSCDKPARKVHPK